MVGVEDEQDVEGPGQDGIGLEPRLGDLPEHGEEVGGEVERVVGVDEGHPDAEAVCGGGQRRHLGDQADDLLVPGLRVEDVLGVEIEGRQRRDGRDEHAHGVGVVVEALEEALADVLMDERVVRDVVAPFGELLLIGQLALEEQVGHLQVGRVLGQLLDGIAPVAQDAGVAVEIRDGALACRCRHEAGVEEPDPGQELGPFLRRDPAVDDRNLHGLAIAIVRDRDALGHVKSPPVPDFGAYRSYDHHASAVDTRLPRPGCGPSGGRGDLQSLLEHGVGRRRLARRQDHGDGERVRGAGLYGEADGRQRD